ncbi:amino acid permease-domain-containing protein [Suillus cothurnatus]|nr:amino acid permease-domain-containing protein [Suillus cothurnatus]
MTHIGGVISTGLFVGTADSLMYGGPIGLLLGYIVMGTIVYCVMITLGEMVAFLPIPGGHIKLAERFVDPAFSFALGWNYWYSWMISSPSEIAASALLINYWNDTVNNSVWVAMCFVVVLTINMHGTGAYGEAEFIFASIKVITITGLIILSIVIDLGGGLNHDRIGFRYWKNPGLFVQYNGIQGAEGQFIGWRAVLTQAAFSFIGTEIVAIAAGEAKNPRRTLPKAIHQVYVRILLFYIGGTRHCGTAQSPFVIATETAGIKSLPSVSRAYPSFCYLELSCCYSNQIVSGDKLVEVNALRRWSYMSSVAGLMTWVGISVTYLRLYKGMQVQGIDRKTLPYYTIPSFLSCSSASLFLVLALR